MSGLLQRAYLPAGPTLARLHASRARIRAIMGPVGSAKTSANMIEAIYIAARQQPQADGVRRTRFAFIRKTYRDLERTLIKSWNGWVAKDVGHWTGGSGGQPAQHALKWRLPDGSVVDTEIIFAAIGENAAEEFMRGFEVTGFYLNEADTLDEEVLTHANSRVGRYPAVDAAAGFAGATWRGVWADFNAPDTDHWIYRRFVEELPEGWAFFRQPPAVVKDGGRWVLNPRAENLRNLPEGYYEEQISGQQEWWVKRFLANEFGFSRDGHPVYPEFSDAVHVAAAPLEPIPGQPLVIGGDAGLTPAAVISQRTPFGQIRWLDELVAPPGGEGARRFGRRLSELLADKYRGFDCVGSGDPAAGARVPTDEQTWLQVMQAATGFPWRPAPTNKLLLRLEAVRAPLGRLLDGQPGLLISPTCKVARKGFNAGYRFRRVAGAAGRFADEPEKNEYSHVHDAGQYAHLGLGEHVAVLGHRERSAQARAQTHAIDGDGHFPQGSFEAAGRQSHALD